MIPLQGPAGPVHHEGQACTTPTLSFRRVPGLGGKRPAGEHEGLCLLAAGRQTFRTN